MEFKKVEIIERITDSNGNVTENMLTVWKNLNLNNNSANLRIGELEICESKRQVKKNCFPGVYIHLLGLMEYRQIPGFVFRRKELFWKQVS